MDLISNNLVNIESSTSAASQSPVRTIQEMPQKATRTKVVPKSAASDPSILFDANDFELQEAEGEDSENDNEFGDFETVPQPEATPKAQPKSGQVSSQTTSVAETKPKPPPEMDLLSLDDPPYSKPTAQSPPLSSPSKLLSFGATATGSASHNRQSSHSSSAKAKPHPTRPSKPVQSVMEKNAASNDDWGAWDDFVAADATEKDRARNRASKEIMSSTDVAAPSIEAPDSWQWDSVETIKATVPTVLDNNAAPPVNVPPPSVLLSAFTGLLGSGNSLFKPMGGQSTSIKQKIMTDPKAVDFIRGYILLASTAAHVIAGRKQRWHRDKILAKSMSISAAGSKGMKLAGVDKAQSAREDRDAADVVAVWRDNVGRLRSAVAAANASSNESLKVPEISETMPVHADKFALTAPKPCVICGLKREERVAKVDQDVEDSFGEWWIDHWGHRACKNFWVEHEQTLRQR
jgi:hypothetical protein